MLPPGENLGAGQSAVKDAIHERLRLLIDPEAGLNVVDLGLIQGIEISEAGHATIEMLVTSPGCPLRDTLVAGVERLASGTPGVTEATAVVLDDVPWHPGLMKVDPRCAPWEIE